VKPSQIMCEFELLAEQLEIRIVQGKGNFKGGYCILEDESVIVVNKNKPIEHRIKCLVQAFSNFKLDSLYVKPILRDLIEKERETSLFKDN